MTSVVKQILEYLLLKYLFISSFLTFSIISSFSFSISMFSSSRSPSVISESTSLIIIGAGPGAGGGENDEGMLSYKKYKDKIVRYLL